MTGFVPAYRRCFDAGELDRRIEALCTLLAPCTLCPCRCGVDRNRELSRCVTPAAPLIASYGAHFGEEPPLSGSRGSGTIFLANCNLRCVFCQNHDISQDPKAFLGRTVTPEHLAAIMIALQDEGCHNINWVSPTHQVPMLIRALAIAVRRGLSIPIVYNTNGYDSLEVLRLLDGIVDIYLPDLKYAVEQMGCEYSRVRDYPAVARAAISEMFRQVGADWQLAPGRVLQRGLFVRMLVLPNNLAGIEENVRWLAEALSPEVAISLMSQYRPSHFAARPGRYPLLARRLSRDEYRAAVEAVKRNNRSKHTYIQPYH